MLTGEIRSQIDSIWNDFWSGGVSNPLSVIEQLTYLLFIKRLDEIHTAEERKANTLKIPMERRIFPEGRDEIGKKGCAYEDMRWSRFKSFEARKMFEVVDEHVFPFLRTLGGEGALVHEYPDPDRHSGGANGTSSERGPDWRSRCPNGSVAGRPIPRCRNPCRTSSTNRVVTKSPRRNIV